MKNENIQIKTLFPKTLWSPAIVAAPLPPSLVGRLLESGRQRLSCRPVAKMWLWQAVRTPAAETFVPAEALLAVWPEPPPRIMRSQEGAEATPFAVRPSVCSVPPGSQAGSLSARGEASGPTEPAPAASLPRLLVSRWPRGHGQVFRPAECGAAGPGSGDLVARF